MPRTRSRHRRAYHRGVLDASSVAPLPLPNWWLRGDGLDIEVGPQWANSWVSINGPTLDKDPNFRVYNLGPLANGQQGALCTSSGGRMIANDTCAPNSPDYTFIAVIDADAYGARTEKRILGS